MTAFQIINLVLGLLSLVAEHTKYTGDDKLAREIQAAVKILEAVAGTPVTKAQLESLRVTKQWPHP